MFKRIPLFVLLFTTIFLSGCGLFNRTELVNEAHGYTLTKDVDYYCSEGEEVILILNGFRYSFRCMESQHYYIEDEDGNEYNVYDLMHNDLLLIEEIVELFDGVITKTEVDISEYDEYQRAVVNENYTRTEFYLDGYQVVYRYTGDLCEQWSHKGKTVNGVRYIFLNTCPIFSGFAYLDINGYAVKFSTYIPSFYTYEEEDFDVLFQMGVGIEGINDPFYPGLFE